MICVNTFALNGNLTVTYKTLIFNNLYLYEFCENFADFIRWHANAAQADITELISLIRE